MSQVDWGTQVSDVSDKPFKFPANVWTRYCIIDDNASAVNAHYHKVLKYYQCTKKDEGHCYGCDYDHEEPQWRFGYYIWVYHTMPNGEAIQPLSGRLEWVSVHKGKFETYGVAKKAAGDLRKCDFMFYCQEATFQKGQEQGPYPNAWWLQDKGLQQSVALAYKNRSVKDLSSKIAKRIPFQKQLERLQNPQQGQGSPGQFSGGPMGQFGGGAPPVGAGFAGMAGFQPPQMPGPPPPMNGPLSTPGGAPTPSFSPTPQRTTPFEPPQSTTAGVSTEPPQSTTAGGSPEPVPPTTAGAPVGDADLDSLINELNS